MSILVKESIDILFENLKENIEFEKGKIILKLLEVI